MKRKINRILWKYFRDRILDIKGFKNNTLHYDRGFLDLFIEIYSEKRGVLGIRKMHNIYKLVMQTSNIEGDIAEVGVYKGGSARVIAEYKGTKSLHLFDTFEGMPTVNEKIDIHREGDFADISLENVKTYLSTFNNIYFYKGCFPESAKELINRPPSFHLLILMLIFLNPL